MPPQSKESLAEFLRKLQVLHGNLNEFLNKFSGSLVSTADYVPVNYTALDGEVTTTEIPALGSFKAQLNALNSDFEALLNANNDSVTLRFSDGSVRSFDMRRFSELVDDLDSIQDTSFQVPTSFRVKNNWFFESFLNPLLFVSLNVQQFIEEGEIDRFEVKRVIVNTNTDSDIQFFNDNVRGRNDLQYKTFLQALENAGIDYVIDDNIVELPVSINRRRGNFSVIKIFEEEEIDTVNGQEVSNLQRKYQLDQLTYIDVVDDSENTKYLEAGDRLLTADDSEYEIASVDRDNNTIILNRIFGSTGIAVGVGNLKIKPEPYKVPELQINVGFNEREAIFVRPISKKLDLTTDKLSIGFGLFTNDLTITLSDESQITLDQYYNNFVSDFGTLMLNFTKERQVPAALSVTPDAPLLDPANFQVVITNSHLQEDVSITELRKKIASKERVDSEISELNNTINKLKDKLNNANVTNEAERQKIQKEITEAVSKKSNLLAQSKTLVSELTLNVSSNPQFAVSPTYEVQGFFEIPAGKETILGTQENVQFITAYRSISKKGTTRNINKSTYIDSSGNQQTGFVSDWIEIQSKVREKELDESSGVYVWQDENTQDADVVNINQVRVPIHKGESVEVKVKTVSEAGFPANPVKSSWSESVIIEFDEQFENVEESSTITQRLFQDETLTKFQEELDARGLDLHLLNSITTGDKYWPHNAEEIASGFFTDEGKIISLFNKMKDMETEIKALRAAIEVDRGVIKVSISDPSGNLTEVRNGDTVSFFAGFYKEDVKNEASDQTISYNYGEIVTKSYTLTIQNTSKTALELAARIAGGIDQKVPEYTSASVDEDYKNNRKYDLVPLSVTTLPEGEIGGFKHKAPFQSAQVKSQFLYSRYVDFGLTNDLYEPVGNNDGSYDYEGQDVNGTTVPYNEGHYLPYYTGFTNGGNFDQHASIWNGQITGSPEGPNGNGYLSEFCIHVDHPYLESWTTDIGTPSAFNDMIMPSMTTDQEYMPFSHGLYFDNEVSKANAWGISVDKQVEFRNTTDNLQDAKNYPIKVGFHPNDEYLVGKYTCGSYLFVGPSTYENISIEGNHPRISKRTIEFGQENALNIPILFQYRCADILAYVGGYRSNETLSNVSYKKKIGIDIYERDNTKSLGAEYGDVFSFDVEISCRYDKEIPTLTPVNVPATGALEKVTFNTEG